MSTYRNPTALLLGELALTVLRNAGYTHRARHVEDTLRKMRNGDYASPLPGIVVARKWIRFMSKARFYAMGSVPAYPRAGISELVAWHNFMVSEYRGKAKVKMLEPG